MKIKTLKQGVVGAALTFLLVSFGITSTPPPVHAQTATLAGLQAQIQTLLAQIIALQAQLQAQGSGSLACVVPQQNLAYGNSGGDVMVLQNFLISRGYAIPAGATGYFGPQTQNALRLFQAAQGISPALGLNYGPLTRARVQAICTIVTTPTPTPASTQPSPTLQGEASLERFTVSDGIATDLEEGDNNAEIMKLSFRVEDGDARLDRIEVGFTSDVGNDEDDPWDTFETISVWDGTTRLATVDASDEDEWDEDSPNTGDYSIRLTGVDQLMREGREVEFTIRVDVQNSVDGTDDGEIWTVFIPDEGIRAIDADNVALHIGDEADAVTINIDEAGASDELIVRRSDEDPDASVLRLEDDRNSGYLEVFAFDLDTDDSEADIEIREIPIEFTVSAGTLDDFVRNARLVVGSDTFTDEMITDGATGMITFSFDRGDFTIEAGDRVTAIVEIEFQSLASMHEGTTIVGHLDADDIEAEGADDLDTNQLQGAANGEIHTLRTTGTGASSDGTSAVVTSVDGSNNDYATFRVSVDLTAFGQDVYIPIGTSGVTYQLQDATGDPLVASGTAVVTSSADEQNNYFYIPEGNTETLTLTVTYLPGVPNTTARLQLMSINFNNTTAIPDQTWTAVPASTYRTSTVIIVN